ncbi:MAG: DUF1801 domain-containing protein [Acidobacteriota bacterium]
MVTRPATIRDYLRSLPDDRRKVLTRVRNVIKKHLPKGYRERINWGMISYEIPLAAFSDTYNGEPLLYAALAAQKNYYAVYLMGPYVDPKQRRYLEEQFAKAGKTLNMGKSCLRFKSLDDLPLEALGTVVASTPPERMIAAAQAARKK